MIIEFGNVYESELVAALHRALALAKAHQSPLTDKLAEITKAAEDLERKSTH